MNDLDLYFKQALDDYLSREPEAICIHTDSECDPDDCLCDCDDCYSEIAIDERNQCWFVDICSDSKERCHFEAIIPGASSCDSVQGKACPTEETDCPDGH
jgi:hypothetical protein